MHLTPAHLLDTLTASLVADPFFALCQVVAWLDPLALETDDPDEVDFDPLNEVALVTLGWGVARRCCPTVYADTTRALRQGLPLATIADRLCQGFNQQLVGGELTDLEQLYWGLPFWGLGVDWHDPAWFEDPDHAPLLEVYGWFGVVVETDSYPSSATYQTAARVAQILAQSLREQLHPRYTQLAWLVEWLFSQTGNTVADCSEEDGYELGLEPLPWGPEELAFNNAMHTEAAEIIAAAQQGLQTLLTNPALQTCFRQHIDLMTTLLRKEPAHDLTRLSLRWLTDPDDPAPH